MSNLWNIPLPPYLEEHTTSNGISASEGLKTALGDPPRHDQRISPIIEWILRIASYLRLLIAITFARMDETFIDLIARTRRLKTDHHIPRRLRSLFRLPISQRVGAMFDVLNAMPVVTTALSVEHKIQKRYDDG